MLELFGRFLYFTVRELSGCSKNFAFPNAGF